MIGLLPLIAMWLFANRPSAPTAAPSRGGAPRWPTPASPPPMPAFRARRGRSKAPSADPGKSSTSLADLHNNPPKLAPASATEPAALTRAAKSAFAARATSLLRRRMPASDATVPVAKLQQILISRGIKVVPDGLYGPRTAKAWAVLAKSKGLPPNVKRVGPKIANVATRAYDSLAVPMIP